MQPAGFSVALSPLLLVMPKAAAARTAAFGKVGWRLLLPRSAGGPVVPASMRVDLPDPSQSAAGLASLIEVGRLLGQGAPARVRFTRFVLGSEVTSYFDDPSSLRSFVSLAAPPLNGDPVTVTTEQAVLSYDEQNPRQPLAASYPAGSTVGSRQPGARLPVRADRVRPGQARRGHAVRQGADRVLRAERDPVRGIPVGHATCRTGSPPLTD